jgi:hypothetical protein
MKLVTILGARPQFIKAAAVSHAIARHNHEITRSLNERRSKFHGNSSFLINEVIIHSGIFNYLNLREGYLVTDMPGIGLSVRLKITTIT